MEYCSTILGKCRDLTNEYINWFDVLIYTGAFIALYFAIKLEYYDLFCPEEGQTCKVGNGAAFAGGKPRSTDDIDTLLQKIRISARYDEASVYWRRCIIFSVLLTFTLLLFVLHRLPTGTEILVSFIIIYLFTFLFLVYYQEVVSKPANQQINKVVEILSS